jgi:clan AA aspartic protease
MITGSVKSDEARIRLTLIDREGRNSEVTVVIDSGYTGKLTLPPDLIASLGMRRHGIGFAELADGRTCAFQVYRGRVVWDGKVRTILVDEADTDPLVGMKLLRGHELKMQIRPGGKVTIKRLPSRESNGT